MPEKKSAAAPEPAVEKYPELRKQFNTLRTEKEKLAAKTGPLRKKRDALLAKIQPMENQVRDLDKKIQAIERPRMAELDNQIAALARAMGARSIQAEGPAPR